MRIEGRRPSARVDAVMLGAFVISRIMASTFLTMSLCWDSSGSLIVGISFLLRPARSLGSGLVVAASSYYPAYAYGREYGEPASGAGGRQDRTGASRAGRRWAATGHLRARTRAGRVQGHAARHPPHPGPARLRRPRPRHALPPRSGASRARGRELSRSARTGAAAPGQPDGDLRRDRGPRRDPRRQARDRSARGADDGTPHERAARAAPATRRRRARRSALAR